MRIVALTGKAWSGKDTVAGFLGGKVMPFAGPIKEFCQQVFDFSDAQIWGPSQERNKPDVRYRRLIGYYADDTPQHEYLTPRYALQTLGTEWGRDCFEDIWADLGMRRAKAYLATHPLETVVIPDCRFVNEARAVRAAGGQVWRIVRPGAGLSGAASAHQSEMEQESPEFNALVNVTIYNDGTLNDLASQIHLLSNWPESF